MKLQASFLIFFACALIALAQDVTANTSEEVCEPGKEITQDCNQCKCNPEGTQYICEEKNCQADQTTTNGVGPSRRADAQTEESCTPGESFKIECNNCRCPDSGLKSQAACTLKACFEGRIP